MKNQINRSTKGSKRVNTGYTGLMRAILAKTPHGERLNPKR